MFEELKEASLITKDFLDNEVYRRTGIMQDDYKKSFQVLLSFAQTVIALDGQMPKEKENQYCTDDNIDDVAFTNGYNLARKEMILAMAGKIDIDKLTDIILKKGQSYIGFIVVFFMLFCVIFFAALPTQKTYKKVEFSGKALLNDSETIISFP